MGLLVIQDMPSMRPDSNPSAEEQEEFQRLLELMIEEHKSYPSIAAWVGLPAILWEFAPDR